MNFINGIAVPSEDNTASKMIEELGRLDWDDNFNRIEEWKALRAGDVAIDVGAFIGDTAIIFDRAGMEVHAFEPREESFQCLKINIPNALCYNIALGNGRTYSVSNESGNIGGKPLLPGKKKSIPLDAIRFEACAVLKIDVEGFGPEVLDGARETIARTRPIIHIEVNTGALLECGHSKEELLAALDSLGYQQRTVYKYSDEQYDLLLTP